jgi:hypothetical protein
LNLLHDGCYGIDERADALRKRVVTFGVKVVAQFLHDLHVSLYNSYIAISAPGVL